MGIFGDKKDEEREEVTIGLKEENNDNQSNESSVNVGAVDFNENSQEAEESNTESEGGLRRQVEQKVAKDSSPSSIDLEDIHEQNEQIKKKLDTIISSL